MHETFQMEKMNEMPQGFFPYTWKIIVVFQIIKNMSLNNTKMCLDQSNVVTVLYE